MSHLNNIYSLDEARSRKRKKAPAVEMAMGEHVSLARQNRCRTQGQLGHDTGFSQQAISAMETGVHPIGPAALAAIARALGTYSLLFDYCDRCPVGLAMASSRRPKLAAVGKEV